MSTITLGMDIFGNATVTQIQGLIVAHELACKASLEPPHRPLTSAPHP